MAEVIFGGKFLTVKDLASGEIGVSTDKNSLIQVSKEGVLIPALKFSSVFFGDKEVSQQSPWLPAIELENYISHAKKPKKKKGLIFNSMMLTPSFKKTELLFHIGLVQAIDFLFIGDKKIALTRCSSFFSLFKVYVLNDNVTISADKNCLHNEDHILSCEVKKNGKNFFLQCYLDDVSLAKKRDCIFQEVVDRRKAGARNIVYQTIMN